MQRDPSMLSEHSFSHPDALFDAAAEQVAEQLERAIAQRGLAMLAVSGGKSPEALFLRLSAMLLPWRRIQITLVDERFVPPDHADSNERLVRETLLQGRAAQAHWLPLYQPGISIEAAAQMADEALQQWPLPFDAVVLGMGDDGHTASWFPDADELSSLLALDNTKRVAVSHPKKAPHARLTLTRAAVLNSRLIQLLIPGANKQPVFQRARQDAAPLVELPVRAVLHQDRVPVHVYRTQ
ncbi:6-phosphogluconolactonase [Permianibacter sp. IMCC34836]|uniref:6-phosphogluconolactonase n=1 Tax=Permianibacter fluminis TaxID=2738515 RepID=UPI0015542C24|nr:6-phosphogluconolactonase [Permianibacter fluminis]NQD37496.1 6-phosphogluconolactonase [Permianibacter fluminis]